MPTFNKKKPSKMLGFISLDDAPQSSSNSAQSIYQNKSQPSSQLSAGNDNKNVSTTPSEFNSVVTMDTSLQNMSVAQIIQMTTEAVLQSLDDAKKTPSKTPAKVEDTKHTNKSYADVVKVDPIKDTTPSDPDILDDQKPLGPTTNFRQ